MKRDAVGNTADWQNTKMRPRERVPTDSELLKDLSKNENYKTTKPFTYCCLNKQRQEFPNRCDSFFVVKPQRLFCVFSPLPVSGLDVKRRRRRSGRRRLPRDTIGEVNIKGFVNRGRTEKDSLTNITAQIHENSHTSEMNGVQPTVRGSVANKRKSQWEERTISLEFRVLKSFPRQSTSRGRNRGRIWRVDRHYRRVEEKAQPCYIL